MNPPVLARALLWMALPYSEDESIPGDLYEEFKVIDPRRAKRWYWRQVLGSLVPLVMERWRRGEVLRSIMILISAVAPLWAANELWRYVLSCVPLKADPSKPIWLLLTVALMELLCLAVVAFLEAKR